MSNEPLLLGNCTRSIHYQNHRAKYEEEPYLPPIKGKIKKAKACASLRRRSLLESAPDPYTTNTIHSKNINKSFICPYPKASVVSQLQSVAIVPTSSDDAKWTTTARSKFFISARCTLIQTVE